MFLGFLKCSHCGEYLTVRKSKDNVYYYCKSYIKDKSCKKYSINRKKLEKYVIEQINDELKISVEVLNRKILNEYVDVIYVIDKNDIKIRLKKEV